ncbi:MAG: hypothetical protein JXR58_13490 [Bacteroidales bacterium]|nr:hypothetical protein [Bacteroidales bacterium]
MAYLPTDFIGTLWRILDGDIYVSSIGDDNNNGSPSSPYKTIQKAIDNSPITGSKIVVGTGTYIGSISGLDKDNIYLIADGITKMTGSIEKLGNNCTFELFDCELFSVNGKCAEVKNCKFYKGGVRSNTGTISKCLFIEALVTATVSNIKSCTFIKSNIGAELQDNFIEIIDCHFDELSIINIDSGKTIIFNYCNQQSGSSVVIDHVNYTSSAMVHAAFSNYQEKGISKKPIFNNPKMQDYTLNQISPLIGVGSIGNQIGAFPEGWSLHSPINSENSYVLVNPELINVKIDGEGNYILDGTSTTGTIDTGEIDLQGVVLLNEVFLYALQIFETPNHNCVVDNDNSFTHPNMLAFELRYSDNPLDTEPYLIFAWGKQPTLDAFGKSNGQMGFDFNTSERIYARYVQLKITLTDGAGDGHHPLFKGTSMACFRSQLVINIKDKEGGAIESAQINIDDGITPITGVSDANGCFTATMTPYRIFTLTITKQFFEVRTHKAVLIRKASLNNPLNNFVIILKDTAGDPIENANIEIISEIHNEIGTTDSNGQFEGTIQADYQNTLTIEKSGITYTHVYNPFITICCGDENLIVVQIIENDFV